MGAVKLLTQSSWFSLFFTWNRDIVDMVTRVFSAWISAILSHFGQIWRVSSHLIPPPFYIKGGNLAPQDPMWFKFPAVFCCFSLFQADKGINSKRNQEGVLRTNWWTTPSRKMCVFAKMYCTSMSMLKHDLNLPHHPASLPVEMVFPHDFCHPSIFQRPVLPTSGFFGVRRV